jgi:uncharacterized protein
MRTKRGSKRMRLVALGLSAGLLSLPALYVAGRAYLAERSCFLQRQHPPRLSADEFGVSGLRAVTFPSRTGDSIAGYFASGPRRATVILAHGSGGERSDLAAEARALALAGFGVLVFDWPGHGESQGSVEWGKSERAALIGAIDWLCARDDVDSSRLGALGFSMGGYVLTQTAVSDLRLRAVALAGSPPRALEHLYWEYRRFGRLTQWPARLALKLAGMRTDELVPADVIARLQPRPVLVIGGEKDELVPPWMAQQLFSAAQQPKQLLLLPQAGHGNYQRSDGDSYTSALVDFFAVLSAP